MPLNNTCVLCDRVRPTKIAHLPFWVEGLFCIIKFRTEKQIGENPDPTFFQRLPDTHLLFGSALSILPWP